MIETRVAVVGAGPAGLMAAEALSRAGLAVDIWDAMPSPGRKLLMAGKGGLNLTHAEPLAKFLERYREESPLAARCVAAFPPAALRDFAAELGVETFEGSSGRVFPTDFKAAPLLRGWLRRLKARGVRLHARHRLTGLTPGPLLTFDDGATDAPSACVLALGGGSWPKLGSDGGWVPLLEGLGVAVRPLVPANCGFIARFSPHMAAFAGTPLKNLVLRFGDRETQGEAVLTADGIEGGAVYALSADLRDAIAAEGHAVLHLDLKRDLSEADIRRRLSGPRRGLSLTNLLRKTLALPPAAIALLRESGDLTDLAARIKSCPVTLTAPRPLAEAISSAGGIRAAELDDNLMLRALPGVFAAGEMLDWEAPTGGYLLTACFATGLAAGEGVARWLQRVGRS
ncbi:MAG: TIGR03862 family flavoprotein [Alphaproteobacteria bacterium]|nr:TIGR03862 family flavoprotein [Alphaproteobacteria bacterium]